MTIDGQAHGPTPARAALGLLAGVTLFVAAGFVGRATIIDGEALSLVWPAAGVAALWIGHRDRRTRIVDLCALGVATFVVNSLTGATPLLAAVFVATNVIQVHLFVRIIETRLPGLWGFGGTQPLARLRDLGELTGAAVFSCLVGASLGELGLLVVLGTADPSNFLVWWGRNAVAVIVIVTLGVLAGQPLAAAGSNAARRRLIRDALTPRSWSRVLEIAVIAATSVGLYAFLFLSSSAAPLAFLVLVMAVWSGIRFAPLAVAMHGLAMGVAGIAFTLAGTGPFASIESLHYRALVAQLFVAMAVLKGLALSFSRLERDQAIADLGSARRAADERAELLDAVLESMTEGVVVAEEGGRILVRNSAGRHLVGLEGEAASRIEPASNYGLFHPDGRPVADDDLPGLRALRGAVVVAEDFHVRSAAVPTGRVVEINAHPLQQVPGTLRRAMVNIRDVTLDRQHRDSLASFAGVVAHDLFNPLSLVDGWAEALDDEFSKGPVSPTVGLPMVARIHDASTNMRDFIADLMAYTVARDQSLRSEQVDLTTLIRGLARLRTTGNNPAVIAVDDDLAAWVDPGLMRQLFDNLIGNAVKYVAPGVRPAVSVSGVRHDDRLEVRVTDNGIGVPADQYERIFDNFHRARTDYHGTGLGLAICRRIVDRHGGAIHAEPGPGGIGTSFVLDVPTSAVGAAADCDSQGASR